METTDIVRKLFDGVVPERASEIESIANDYDAQFRLIGDREGFTNQKQSKRTSPGDIRQVRMTEKRLQ